MKLNQIVLASMLLAGGMVFQTVGIQCYGVSGSFPSPCTTTPDGVRITFNPNGTNAGLNVGAHTSAPSSLTNGDIWYDSTGNKFKCRENGSSVDCIGGGGGSISGPGSSTDNAVVRWDGTAGTSIQNSLITLSDTGAFTFPDGVKQTFNPDGTTSGFNVGSQAGDPSTPANGDIWYDSTANELTARINSANVALGSGGGGGETCIVAASDESDSDNTVHSDAELLFSVDASTTYLFRLVLFFNTGTSNTPDAKYRFTLPASATLTQGGMALTVAATTTATTYQIGEYRATTPTAEIAMGVLTTATQQVSSATVHGTIVVAGTSGTVQLQWAQNTTTGGTPTVRKADSQLCYRAQ